MSSCRGEQVIVDEWREDEGMDEWREDIVIRGSSSVCYGHLTVSLNATLNSDIFIMKTLFLIHLTFFLLLLLFLALSRGSECMPIDSRSR